jgi:uncharacterized protein (TIGR02145 family)
VSLFTRQGRGRTLLLLTAVVVGAVSSTLGAQDSSYIPIKANVDATVTAVPKTNENGAETVTLALTANTVDTLILPYVMTTGVTYFGGQRHGNTPSIVANRGGNVTVNLPAQSYRNAEISLHTVNGKRVLRNKVSSANAVNVISRGNVATGIYLLSVKGSDGKAVTARLTHSGGGLSINASFADGDVTDARKMAKEAADVIMTWTVTTVSAVNCYESGVFTIQPNKWDNPQKTITLLEKHNWGNWAVTTPATCAAAGVETRTCKIDASHKETRATALLTGAVCKSTFTDSRDGTVYKTVIMAGGYTWMAENLNYATRELSGNGAWCYGDADSNCVKYGRLYDWATAMTVCPAGWHLPTDDEWGSLGVAAGAGETAGKKLKSATGWNNNGTASWSSSGNGTDDYGFSALPGGSYNGGSFSRVGEEGAWWTTREGPFDGLAIYKYMHSSSDEMVTYYSNKSTALSVRCVQD